MKKGNPDNILFELDLTNCKLPKHLDRPDMPLVILCEPGSHQMDFDVYNKDSAGMWTCENLLRFCYQPCNPNIPVGFDLLSLPVGAVLRRVR